MSQQERKAREERLASLRARGIDPYPARIGAIVPIGDVRERFDALDAEQLEAKPEVVAVAGRVMASRSFGKLRFFELLEDGTRIQVSARKAEMDAEAFAFVKEIDVGDFVRCEGPVWRTRTGELTVDARRVELVSKSLLPLPEKWHGLQQVEARYRQRYLDLLANPEAREIAIRRSRIVSAMRAFLDGRGFLEVETPILQPLYGGASARPFMTHHNQLGQDLYLRISDELYLKRLVIGGLDRVYEIGRDFRNEGISRKHDPEFTMMECYQAFADYRDMMALVEAMVPAIAEGVLGQTRITYDGKEIELAGPWPRISMRDAILEGAGVDVLAAPDLASLREAVRARAVPVDAASAPTWGVLVDELFSELVEPTLVQPTFIVDYPVELSPLAKQRADEPRLVERFELFIAGMEIANAFSELNDPHEQRARWEAQRRDAEAGDEEAQPLDEDFLRALDHGMPPTGGLGLGVGRLVMVLCDTPSLREVKLFPHLRPEGG